MSNDKKTTTADAARHFQAAAPPPLEWPSKAHAALESNDGWYIAGPPTGCNLALRAAEQRAFRDAPRPAIIHGARYVALRSLKQLVPSGVKCVYLDLPRCGYFQVREEELRVSTWLSLVHHHIAAAFSLLASDGQLIIHIDDEGLPLTRLVADDQAPAGGPESTIVWQKKYSAQQDLTGRIDDAQDYLLVYSASPRKAIGGTTWWDFQSAGKTEDATREVEELRNSGVVTLQTIPKTSKPEKLLKKLFERYTRSGDVIVEVFSDTAFAAASAVACGRIPILCGGATREDTERLTKCCIPRIAAALTSAGLSSKDHLLQAEAKADDAVRPSSQRLREGRICIAHTAQQIEPAAPEAVKEIYAVELDRTGSTKWSIPPCPSMHIAGQPLPTFRALRRMLRAAVELCSIDLRCQAASKGPLLAKDDYVPTLASMLPLMTRTGVIAAYTDDVALPAIRLALDSLVGRQQYVGTAAVEVPTGGDVSRHEYAVIYRATPLEKKAHVGLPASRKYSCDDGDPRGPWRDTGHKGARSGSASTARPYHAPPYRWRLLKGKLPLGAWRLNPITGTIWSPSLEKEGTYKFTVEVTDARGQTTSRELSITVASDGEEVRPERVWFLGELTDRGQYRTTVVTSKGSPTIRTRSLPQGAIGKPYSVVLEAEGGKPWGGPLLPGRETEDGKRTRYWEFGEERLTNSIIEDRVFFGANGTSNPSFKVHETNEKARTTVDLSWWSKDCLGDAGPFDRLLRIFTQEGDLVLQLGPGMDFVTVAPQLSRRLVVCACGGEDARKTPGFLNGNVIGPIGHLLAGGRRLTLEYGQPSFGEALLWAEGYMPLNVAARVNGIPVPTFTNECIGVSPDGDEAAVLLKGDDWPTLGRCRSVVEALAPVSRRIVVYFFRGSPPSTWPNVTFRRVPFELTVRS